MTLYFAEYVSLLNLALGPAESIFDGRLLSKSNFSQTNCTPKLVPLWTG
jgi:hypothetical protein